MPSLSSLATTLGLTPVLHSSRDTHLLCLARFTRLFAYGLTTIILVPYLRSQGLSEAQAGLFMTLTLLGDVVLSLLLTLFADGLGRRRVLCAGATLMVASGTVFAVGAGFGVLVVASVLGVISPSGNEIGPFRAIEESVLAQLTPKDVRNDVFIWYTLFGTAGAALGNAVCGWLMQRFENRGIEAREGHRIVFWIYAGLGVVKVVAIMLLSRNVEPEPQKTSLAEDGEDAEGLLTEIDEQDEHSNERVQQAKPTAQQRGLSSKIASLVPRISRDTRSILIKLSILFAVDSLASGLATPTWITYYFITAFNLAPALLGSLFMVTNILAAFSNLVAAPLARKIGLIKTMVFTHLPSAILLALIPLPSQAWLAMLFTALRASMQSMDQAPRQAFLAAAVLPSERTAVMGIINVVKTLAQSGGPSLAGWLAGSGRFWAVFVAAGSMKVAYDLTILKMFVGFKGREGET